MRLFTIFSVICYTKDRLGMGRYFERSSLLSKGFFSNGLIRDDFKEEGKVPVRRKRLTMERIIEAISLAIFLRTVLGIWSRLQCELGD